MRHEDHYNSNLNNTFVKRLSDSGFEEDGNVINLDDDEGRGISPSKRFMQESQTTLIAMKKPRPAFKGTIMNL